MTEQKAPAIEVGQTVWVEYHDKRWGQDGLHKRTVTGIGRKWVALSARDRFDRTHPDLPLDGGHYSSGGRVWLSEADYHVHAARADAWHQFRRALEHAYRPPANADLAGIQTAAAALGIALTPYQQEATR